MSFSSPIICFLATAAIVAYLERLWRDYGEIMERFNFPIQKITSSATSPLSFCDQKPSMISSHQGFRLLASLAD